jgi:hypothetical protein
MDLQVWTSEFCEDNQVMKGAETNRALVRCVNSVIRDMNTQYGLSLSEITALTGTLSVPSYALNAFDWGVLYYAQAKNLVTRKFDVNLEGEYMRRLRKGMTGNLAADSDLTFGYVNSYTSGD